MLCTAAINTSNTTRTQTGVTRYCHSQFTRHQTNCPVGSAWCELASKRCKSCIATLMKVHAATRILTAYSQQQIPRTGSSGKCDGTNGLYAEHATCSSAA